jgi:hypothetical protein
MSLLYGIPLTAYKSEGRPLNQFKTPLASCAAAASRVKYGLPYAAERIRGRLELIQWGIVPATESVQAIFPFT